MVNAKLNLFEAVKAKLKADVPEVKTFRLFNNQFEQEKIESAFLFPAVMLEFADLVYVTKAEGRQEAETLFLLHVGYSSLKTEDTAIFTLIQKITASLQGFTVQDLCTPLVRTRELQDANYDRVSVWKLEFSTLLIDDSGNRKNKLVKVTTAPELEITKDVGKPFLKPTP